MNRWLFGPADTNLKLILAILIDVFILLLIAHGIGKAWMAFRAKNPNTTDWIAKAPTTNLRILNGIVLADIFVTVMLIGIVLGKTMDFDNIMTLGGFILLQMGLDVTQFWQKRKTFDSSALGMTRESAEPAPPTPAAVVVQDTGIPPVPPQMAPTGTIDKIPGSGD